MDRERRARKIERERVTEKQRAGVPQYNVVVPFSIRPRIRRFLLLNPVRGSIRTCACVRIIACVSTSFR